MDKLTVALSGAAHEIAELLNRNQSPSIAADKANVAACIKSWLAPFLLMQRPDLPSCPGCGGIVMYVPNFGGYVTCISDGCHVSGPDNDPDCAKWKSMCFKISYP
jgi:hypothetical protein